MRRADVFELADYREGRRVPMYAVGYAWCRACGHADLTALQCPPDTGCGREGGVELTAREPGRIVSFRRTR